VEEASPVAWQVELGAVAVNKLKCTNEHGEHMHTETEREREPLGERERERERERD
jgi:hypothetical protein